MERFFELELEDVPEEDKELVMELLVNDWRKH